MTTYLGFAVADSMFPPSCTIAKVPMTIEDVRASLSKATSCCNPFHAATLHALKARYDLDVPVPDKAPVVSAKIGDRVIVLSVRGLPRLEGRHEYTAEEIEKAAFVFSCYTVG
jgi:hypothetical protein